ncbi:MAG: response regulator [Candidatus Omnitrophica bacterium]|nr:response regulator [Candidatus Omnitrophota bacterium]
MMNFNEKEKNDKVFLLPGELCVSKEPVQIGTILGSCVGVCLFNRKRGFGGMNHFMIPLCSAGNVPSGKYGDYSMEVLINMMLAIDSNVQNIEATILGGASVMGHLSVGKGIAAKNIVIAHEILNKYGIKIIHKNIGGDVGRKVFFNNWNGEFKVTKILQFEQRKMLEEKKKAYGQRKIKVLIVDDSKTVRNILSKALSEDPDIEVVAQAEDAYEARKLLLELDPDVICLDIIMPKLDGLTFLKKLFIYMPKPVIIISTITSKGSQVYERAKKIGAVEVLDKAELNLFSDAGNLKSVLSSKIKYASCVWVGKKTSEELEQL